MEIRFRKANGWMRVTDLYEWQPQGSQKWYPVHRNNVLALEGYEGERKILNRALKGEVLSLKALYLRKEKLLLVAGD